MSDPAVPPAPNPVALTGAQRRALRALGHPLRPVVQVGRNGVTDGVVAAVATALEHHELIKLQLPQSSPAERKTDAQQLAARTGSHVAQVIGRTALLYRRRYDTPAVHIPGSFEEAPRPRPAPAPSTPAEASR